MSSRTYSCALKNELASVLLAKNTERWADLTKGRVYDFTGKRAFIDESGVAVDVEVFIRDEMEKHTRYHNKQFKSWKGDYANIIKNINAQRYKQISWDAADRNNHSVKVKAQKKASPKSKVNKADANAKRRFATKIKGADKLLSPVIARHAQIMEAHTEWNECVGALMNMEPDSYGQSVVSRRRKNGRKHWTGVGNPDFKLVRKLNKQGALIQQKDKEAWMKKQQKQKMKKHITKALAQKPRRVRQTTECPFW